VVKEWLYQLLGATTILPVAQEFIIRRWGSLIRVADDETHQLGSFEAGISQPGEMEKLEKIIYPTIGVFTNIGEAHSEGFMNARQK